MSDVDRVIKVIGDDINQALQLVRSKDVVTATLGDTAVIFSGVSANFRADRIIKAWVVGAPKGLNFVSDQYIDHLIATENRTGHPEMIGWSDNVTATVYPIPTVNETISFQWVKPFTTWTDGAVDGTTIAIVLNIPEDYLRLGLLYGSTSLLQHQEPEMGFQSASWQKYEKWRDSLAIKIKGRVNPIRLSQGSMILES